MVDLLTGQFRLAPDVHGAARERLRVYGLGVRLELGGAALYQQQAIPLLLPRGGRHLNRGGHYLFLQAQTLVSSISYDDAHSAAEGNS